jgi:hypothetical protein
MAHMIENLPSKYKALSSNSSTAKRKKMTSQTLIYGLQIIYLIKMLSRICKLHLNIKNK